MNVGGVYEIVPYGTILLIFDVTLHTDHFYIKMINGGKIGYAKLQNSKTAEIVAKSMFSAIDSPVQFSS